MDPALAGCHRRTPRPTSSFQSDRRCTPTPSDASMLKRSRRITAVTPRRPQRRRRSVFPGPGVLSCLPGEPDDRGENQQHAQDVQPNGSLLVVGPGVLGTYLGKLWLDEIQTSVVGQSPTDSSHERLRAVGITPRLNSDACGSFSWVVFCAPISKVEDVEQEFNRALSLWDKQGSFVYTSSIGVYPETGETNEDSPLQPMGTSERVDRMLTAERVVLEGGGNIVRLAGLYHSQRGPHTFFGRMGTVDRPGDSTVNLIHYEDAASLVLKVLLGGCSDLSSAKREGFRSEVFVGTDGIPVTFQAMMDAAAACGVCPSGVEFVGTQGTSKQKTVGNSKTRQVLGNWVPKHKSFIEFMEAGGRDWYSTCGLF